MKIEFIENEIQELKRDIARHQGHLDNYKAKLEVFEKIKKQYEDENDE